ncbi:hypothetical protein LzC2_12100 [Planctomycetes bacterium LzC2]|uniref:Regulator of chromosome condensation (RCC1) repeat-containing protein n=1 Tax=Alienimonas chondri TaxID=2681879 RepID=A0ABX1VB90_9PLAN|nr:hypothetical protein [Alienimonas chondri]
MQGRHVLVLISPDRSKVWGWSQSSGKMTPLPVDVPEEERGKVQPIVGQDVAMLVVGGTVYAFGGSSGKWGSHPVGERDAVNHLGVPVVGTTVAATRTADGVYAYSGVSGKGGLHELGEGEEAVAPSVGIDYAMVRSPKSFGMFSAETGTWGSVRYPQPQGESAPDNGGEEGPGEPDQPADSDADRGSSNAEADEATE